MTNTYYVGSEAELTVINQIRDLDYECKFIDDFYDIEVYDKNNSENKLLLEVKSTQLLIKNGDNKTRYGRFNFLSKENIKLHRKYNVVYVFVVRIDDKYEIIGCSRARTLKNVRHIKLTNIMCNRRLKSIEKLLSYSF